MSVELIGFENLDQDFADPIGLVLATNPNCEFLNDTADTLTRVRAAQGMILFFLRHRNFDPRDLKGAVPLNFKVQFEFRLRRLRLASLSTNSGPVAYVFAASQASIRNFGKMGVTIGEAADYSIHPLETNFSNDQFSIHSTPCEARTILAVNGLHIGEV